ncbi:undecaprenyl-diphosphate phosphatase [Asticcacaulis machinosus]|uniref:Undecaprenyl-diphosphatase n=1 Tax=Asticcacaulis machinosus TaxID=2984211 RepID=A0ABT5HLD4_9CAUL|nr:undecaprenyl-diphosphate phosphatase [Asticcacaulis machinosus]MDC7677038.1 undecaprenyl-diphosphate phosphatase [Asticcacaulis machinosus]
MDYLIALLLGFVEGLTEYIPVSSTGHLLLLSHFLNFSTTGKTFEVLIQLGAVLALLSLYFNRLWNVVITLPSNPQSRGFVISILVAFLPALVLGVLLHDFIKGVLFESPQTICYALIIGGILLWLVDRFAPTPTHNDAMRIDVKTALAIGLFQCLAMIPGMSRSGSTLIGAMLMKVEKKAAAEFSFFLAMPTMAGAFAYDIYKTYDQMDFSDVGLIATGFIAAFVTALFVVRAVLDFVSKHGYGVFALWRLAVGITGLILLHYGVVFR